MSDTVGTVTLTQMQVQALEAAGKWVDSARSEVGDRYLRLQELRAELAQAELELSSAVLRARKQEAQHAQILLAIGQELNLPPGDWRYDAGAMRLVKREPDDA